MPFQKELNFTQKLLEHFRIRFRYLTADTLKNLSSSDKEGLAYICNFQYDPEQTFQFLEEHCLSNMIYRLKNVFLCHYILLRLPHVSNTTFLLIGPYLLEPVKKSDIYHLAERLHVIPSNLCLLQQFYSHIPVLSDENILFTLLYTLGEYLWDGTERFSVSDDFPLFSYAPFTFFPFMEQTSEEALSSIRIMEARYEIESGLIQAVSNGNLPKAELYFSQFTSMQLEPRTENPVRDYKNYAIILNTLLRKAAEYGAVHPIQIDAVSTQYARKIELITSRSSFLSLARSMIRNYCFIVKNHSLKNYSILVRKVISTILYDLSADLSLRTLASHFHVTSSYLSTLFRKETGFTLTEYVNRKRIEHAVFLLNSTDMQIQTIASYCGIPDVNYFSKLFKKHIGQTPKEYRKNVMHSK